MTTTALTVVQRAAVALQSESAAAHLTALAASTKDIGAPTNRAGREQCHAAAMAALKARAAEETERQRKRDEEDARLAITSEIRQQIDAELETFSDCELRIVLDFVRKMPL